MDTRVLHFRKNGHEQEHGGIMRIIETSTAPNPRRLRIFLAEKGIEVPFEQVDLMAGDLKTDAFTRMNPTQRVPVLVLDDGTAVSESVAICRYFEELQPEPPLFGLGPLERALVEMWQRRVELGFFAHVTHAFRHLHPKMAPLELPQVGPWGEANRPKALEALAAIDRHLGGSRFLVGERFTIADITLLVAVDFMKPARLVRPPELVNIERWHGEVSSRPSAAA